MTDYVWYPVTGDGQSQATAFTWNTGQLNWNTGTDWAQGDTLVFQNPSNSPGAVPGSGTGNSQGPGLDSAGLIAGDVSATVLSFYTPDPSKGDPYIASRVFSVDVLINTGTVDIDNLLLSQFNQYALTDPPQVPTLEVSGATLKVEGSITNSQTVVFPTISTFIGTYGGTTTATGGGIVDIESGGTVQVAGSVQPQITMNFSDANLDHLNLGDVTSAQPNTFSGTVAGFVHGDTIELTNVPYTAGDVATFLVNTLTITNGAATLATIPMTGVYTSGEFQFQPGINGTDILTCFASGTRILTPGGHVAVEMLAPGDLVRTRIAGKAMPITWIGRRHVDCRRHPRPEQVYPIRVRADAFGEGLPERDVLLSPDHAIFIDGALIAVKHLIDNETIVREPRDELTYYHIELAMHDVVLAEGLPVETYLDAGDRSAFDNGGGPVALHADFTARRWEMAGCAPRIEVGLPLERIRRRLRERASRSGREDVRRLTRNQG